MDEIPLSVAVHGSLICAIIGSTFEHLSRGKELFNPFFRTKVSKTGASLRNLLVCAVVGGAFAYFVSMVFYAPDTPIRAVFIGFVVTPYVHENRVTQFLTKKVR